MKKIATEKIKSVFPILLILAGVLPLLQALILQRDLATVLIAVINLIAWLFATILLIVWRRVEEHLRRSAERLRIQLGSGAIDSLIFRYIREIERRDEAILSSTVEQRLATKEELARSLEKITSLSFRLLGADSVELALVDRDTGLYHSSFVLGKPFRKSTQMIFSSEEEEAGVMVSPIKFAGSILGYLRVGLKGGREPTHGDFQILNLLALQSSMAVLNTEFTKELLRMHQISEESLKAKTGFLANLSHEIRGPLSIMMNAVDLVLEGLCGEVSADQKETLDMVKSNGKHLLDLINDVLDYAKAESGRINVDPVVLDVDELLGDIRKVISVQAEAKSHRLIYRSIGPNIGVKCDKRHARQILINLLTNAVKYTPNGGSIDLWAERVPSNKIKINVRDSGIGIRDTDREKVFAAFERIENEYSSKQMGTGLGMSLTRKLVELNHGSIDFVSKPGKGSQFWIILPAGELSNEEEEKPASVNEEILGHGKSVLILSRENEERKTTGRYLAKYRFSLAYASTSEEAVEVLKNSDISVVVLDDSLPEIEKGTEKELVSALREYSKNPKIPIILLSRRAFAFDVENYLKAGVDKCLAKPVELQELARNCAESVGNPT
ncbi:MAG: response regulator [SAR324 cluster bacterium]|uniref:histidine kinase n=1 Tax=SAR324 cluster bacterium TaxID=2024889 RepID=A0A7X9FSH6_9DELT|nr:response regulator [SAR324 cluster bacterium]